MKKLLSILGAITLIGTTSTSVIACGNGQKPNPDTRIDLSEIIKISILGAITMAGNTPTKTELLEAIKDKNPTTASALTENDFDFDGNATGTNAVISGKNNYKGKISLTFRK